MSILTILVPLVIAVLAMLIHAAGAWTARSMAAMFGFAFVLLLLPLLVRA